MSNSYKKVPISAITKCQSQKKWKQSYNRTFRRVSKQKLKQSINTNKPFTYDQVYKMTYSDIWSSPSDGKYYAAKLSESEFNKLKKSFHQFGYSVILTKYFYINGIKSYQEYKNLYRKWYIGK